MGFTIVEPVLLDRFGISLPNLYATFHGSLNIIKMMLPTLPPNIQLQQQVDQYRLEGRLALFVSKDQSLQRSSPVRQEVVSITLNEFPSNPMAMLYTKAKELFPSKTFIDV